MKTIIVSDIFGRTPHLEELAKSLSSDCTILDPYSGQLLEFESESEAYGHYSTVCGLNTYTDLVQDALLECEENAIVIGFSAGASAVWNVLESHGAQIIGKAICFYGSRIRDRIDLKPVCETLLVFPEKEKHFSVSALSRFLARTPGVQCIDTEFHHGFMNKLSGNFDETGYWKYLEWLKGICA